MVITKNGIVLLTSYAGNEKFSQHTKAKFKASDKLLTIVISFDMSMPQKFLESLSLLKGVNLPSLVLLSPIPNFPSPGVRPSIKTTTMTSFLKDTKDFMPTIVLNDATIIECTVEKKFAKIVLNYKQGQGVDTAHSGFLAMSDDILNNVQVTRKQVKSIIQKYREDKYEKVTTKPNKKVAVDTANKTSEQVISQQLESKAVFDNQITVYHDPRVLKFYDDSNDMDVEILIHDHMTLGFFLPFILELEKYGQDKEDREFTLSFPISSGGCIDKLLFQAMHTNFTFQTLVIADATRYDPIEDKFGTFRFGVISALYSSSDWNPEYVFNNFKVTKIITRKDFYEVSFTYDFCRPLRGLIDCQHRINDIISRKMSYFKEQFAINYDDFNHPSRTGYDHLSIGLLPFNPFMFLDEYDNNTTDENEVRSVIIGIQTDRYNAKIISNNSNSDIEDALGCGKGQKSKFYQTLAFYRVPADNKQDADPCIHHCWWNDNIRDYEPLFVLLNARVIFTVSSISGKYQNVKISCSSVRVIKNKYLCCMFCEDRRTVCRTIDDIKIKEQMLNDKSIQSPRIIGRLNEQMNKLEKINMIDERGGLMASVQSMSSPIGQTVENPLTAMNQAPFNPVTEPDIYDTLQLHPVHERSLKEKEVQTEDSGIFNDKMNLLNALMRHNYKIHQGKTTYFLDSALRTLTSFFTDDQKETYAWLGKVKEVEYNKMFGAKSSESVNVCWITAEFDTQQENDTAVKTVRGLMEHEVCFKHFTVFSAYQMMAMTQPIVVSLTNATIHSVFTDWGIGAKRILNIAITYDKIVTRERVEAFNSEIAKKEE